MPNWKKVVTSGSNAQLNHVTASGNIKASGNISSSGDLTINDIYVVEGKKIYFDGTDSAPNTYIHKSGLALNCYVLGAQKISVSNTNTVFSNNDVQIGSIAGGNHQDLTVNGNISSSGNVIADVVYTDLIQSTGTSANLYTSANF